MLRTTINGKTVEVKKIGNNFFYIGLDGNKVKVEQNKVQGIKPKKEKYNPFLDNKIDWIGIYDSIDATKR